MQLIKGSFHLSVILLAARLHNKVPQAPCCLDTPRCACAGWRSSHPYRWSTCSWCTCLMNLPHESALPVYDSTTSNHHALGIHWSQHILCCEVVLVYYYNLWQLNHQQTFRPSSKSTKLATNMSACQSHSGPTSQSLQLARIHDTHWLSLIAFFVQQFCFCFCTLFWPAAILTVCYHLGIKPFFVSNPATICPASTGVPNSWIEPRQGHTTRVSSKTQKSDIANDFFIALQSSATVVLISETIDFNNLWGNNLIKLQ